MAQLFETVCMSLVFNNSNFAHPKQACNNAQQGNVTP